MDQLVKELYVAKLKTGRRIVVVPDETGWELSIGDKKRKIVEDLNKKLDGLVKSVYFYGYADIDQCESNKKRYRY